MAVATSHPYSSALPSTFSMSNVISSSDFGISDTLVSHFDPVITAFQAQTSWALSPPPTISDAVPETMSTTSLGESSSNAVSSAPLLPLPFPYAQPEHTTLSKGHPQSTVHGKVAGGVCAAVVALLIAGTLWGRWRYQLKRGSGKEVRVEPFSMDSDRADTIDQATEREVSEEGTSDAVSVDDITDIIATSRSTSVRATVGGTRSVEPSLRQGEEGRLTYPPVPPVPCVRQVYAQDAGVRLAGGSSEVMGPDRVSVTRTESRCSTLPPPYSSF